MSEWSPTKITMSTIQQNMNQAVRKDINSTSILQQFKSEISKEYTFQKNFNKSRDLKKQIASMADMTPNLNL